MAARVHAVVVGGDDLTDELCAYARLPYGAKKVFRASGAEGLGTPVDRRDGRT